MSDVAIEDTGDDEGEDTNPIEWVRFAFRAARRRKRLARGTFVVAVALTVAGAALWPRTYTTESRIVVERNAIMPALADPHRSVPVDYEAPTKGAQDAILAHDSLEKLIAETNLEQRWTANRPPLLHAKDVVTALFRPPPTETDKERALVAMLEKNLHITVDNTSIGISLDWTDPVSAYDIVTTVQKNYLDARHNVEVSVISEAIAILEQHANEERDNVAAALTEMQRLRAEQDPQAAPAPAPGSPQVRYVPAPGQRAVATSNPNADLLKQLDEKRKAIKNLEDTRQRKLNELNGQLTDLRATLAAAHPAVLEVERKIEAARGDSPELLAMRGEERDLLARIAAANDIRTAPAPTGGTATERLIPVPVATAPLQREPHGVLPNGTTDDTLVEAQRQKLQSATIKYQDLMDRIDSAHIELETARAAFKYRYTVVIAPEVSKSAKKPNVPLVLVAGLLLSLLLALALPMGADLASGRVVESWHTERRLKLPVLGEVTRF